MKPLSSNNAESIRAFETKSIHMVEKEQVCSLCKEKDFEMWTCQYCGKLFCGKHVHYSKHHIGVSRESLEKMRMERESERIKKELGIKSKNVTKEDEGKIRRELNSPLLEQSHWPIFVFAWIVSIELFALLNGRDLLDFVVTMIALLPIPVVAYAQKRERDERRLLLEKMVRKSPAVSER